MAAKWQTDYRESTTSSSKMLKSVNDFSLPKHSLTSTIFNELLDDVVVSTHFHRCRALFIRLWIVTYKQTYHSHFAIIVHYSIMWETSFVAADDRRHRRRHWKYRGDTERGEIVDQMHGLTKFIWCGRLKCEYSLVFFSPCKMTEFLCVYLCMSMDRIAKFSTWIEWKQENGKIFFNNSKDVFVLVVNKSCRLSSVVDQNRIDQRMCAKCERQTNEQTKKG